MSKAFNRKEKKYTGFIVTVSILIPIVVSLLFFADKIEGYDFYFLPPVYAGINGLTAILLVLAIVAVKNGRLKIHQWLMTTCIFLSIIFLLLYMLYHGTTESTIYGGDWKYVYYSILLSHILLSVAIVPLVLITYVRTLQERFDKHRKIGRITFPIWLYVATTGVIVYLMISPYYPS